MRGGPEGEVTLPQRAPPDPSPKLTVKKSKVSKIQEDNYCLPFHILIVPYNIFFSLKVEQDSPSAQMVCVCIGKLAEIIIIHTRMKDLGTIIASAF